MQWIKMDYKDDLTARQQMIIYKAAVVRQIDLPKWTAKPLVEKGWLEKGENEHWYKLTEAGREAFRAKFV